MLATAMERGVGVSPATVTLASRDSLRFQQQFGQPIEATPTALPGVGVSSEASATIIDRARALPQDVPFADLPIEQRVFTVPVENALTVLVVELVRNLPLTRSVYAELAADNTLKALILSDELGGADHVRDAFGYEALAAKHNFSMQTVVEEEDFSDVDLGG